MDHRIFEDRYLLHLNDFLNMLPSIKPRKAHTLIKNWQDQLFEQMLADTWSDIEKETYKIKVSENLTIQSNDFEHIFFGDGFSTKRITPYGAKIICQAYKNGLFETKVLMQEFLIPLEVQEYIDSTDSILDKQNTNASRRKKAKDEYKQKISQLELINESEFSYTLFSDIFAKNFGFKGNNHVLEIGGIQVTKSLSLYRSNSGHSADWQVTFSWDGSDGQHKTLQKDSFYSGNRRNDADRNYGLHE